MLAQLSMLKFIFAVVLLVVPLTTNVAVKERMADSAQRPQFEDAADNISANLYVVWDSYERGDADEYNEMLADKYVAVNADGTIHNGELTAKQLKETPITRFALDHLEIKPVGTDTFLVTYGTDVDIPSDTTSRRATFRIGEVWVKVDGLWVCRYRQTTPTKNGQDADGAESKAQNTQNR